MSRQTRFPSFFLEFNGAEDQIQFQSSFKELDQLFDNYLSYSVDGLGDFYAYFSRIEGKAFQVRTSVNLGRLDGPMKIEWLIFCKEMMTAEAVISALGTAEFAIQWRRLRP